MDADTMHQLGTEVLETCTLEDGKLVLADQHFLKIGERIQASNDKAGWSTALIALANRLRSVPGAGPATERITALAALAIGDSELNALISRELRRK